MNNNISSQQNNLTEKTYILESLDCANCAAKMEQRIQAIPEVRIASITFATKQLTVLAPDPDDLLSQMEAICQSIEGHVKITEKHHAKAAAGKEKKGFFTEHKIDLLSIAIGVLLFAAGLILKHRFLDSDWLLVPFAAGYLILGWEVLWTAIRNILKGQVFDENFLMSIATLAAFCIGDYAEGMGVMLFYRIGEFFEHVAVEKSRSQIMDAVDMRPEVVNLIEEEQHQHDHHHDHLHCDCGHEHHHDHDQYCNCDHSHDHHHGSDEIRIVAADEIRPGQILLVRPGDRIPLDGMVIEGESRIDTSPVTGEPVPVKAAPGTEVISGCVNTNGLLKIKVLKPLSESMVTRILDSVENAAAGKPKIDKFITRFARIYTPIVVTLAVLVAILPSLITGEWLYWIKTAITFLVISCPCALVISVPLAFFSGIGAASRLGILFKGGLSIEALKNVKGVIMDKTGTITNGSFTVQRIIPTAIPDAILSATPAASESTSSTDSQNDDIESIYADAAECRLLALAAACEAGSTHPIAASITEAATARKLTISKAEQVVELAGMGIKATLPEGVALCGNMALMEHFSVNPTDTEASAYTRVFLALNDTYLGCIDIADTIKDDALSAIEKIKVNGLAPAMLTGDGKAGADAVAKAIGIEKVFSQLMPEDKLTVLKELRQDLGPVMFVGDGINDAPVLAGADVGAAMGSGADAAIEAADVVFMSSSVEAIPRSISIAKATGSIAIQNVVFALAIKALVLLLGLLGFANIWAAVFADTGVAMLCILNSLRILWKKF